MKKNRISQNKSVFQLITIDFKRLSFLFVLLCSTTALLAQKQALKVGNNPATINNSAALDVESTSKGLLPPRMTTAQRDAIANPAKGLIVYDLTLDCLLVNKGTPATPNWECVGGSSIPAWTAATAAAITSTGTCTLITPTSIRCVFSYTGADQTFTTPQGVTLASVKLWGAGGGGGGHLSEGAGGGFISGNISSLATSYTVIVGQGGVSGGTTTTYGGGGAGGGSSSGSGGGRSAIRSGSTELVTSGAGGGASGGAFAFDDEGSGGVGGGSTGGRAPSWNTAGCNLSGNGGTQSAGGTIPPDGDCSNVTAGSQFTGGIGGNCLHRGGGGGSGWFGGSGGNSKNCGAGEQDAGGGGGSSGASSTVTVLSNTAGFRKTAGNNTDTDYAAGIGVGGNVGANGGNGRVVISFSR